jgi:hypothetical protein
MRIAKGILAGIALVALLAFPFVIYLNAQALSDWAALRGYTPPAAVTSLATQDTMTDYARHVFYVNHPDIESDPNQFRSDCNETEKTIILGCYHSNQAGIFIYDVQDDRLAGVEQVTSAHEMLHAAYDRLSAKEKDNVNKLLLQFFNNDLKDQRVIDTINSYKQSEPNDVVNEMHSVFGTEVAMLPAPLEAYYTKYFTNRKAITDFAASYQKEFNNREDLIKAYDAQLKQMKASIDSQEQSLQTQLAQLSSDRARIDSERSSGQIDKYNSEVPSFNSEVSQYNNGVAKLHADITAYNRLVDQYNGVAKELASLQQALDTRLTAQSAQ